MNLLITGATGFLGSSIVEKFAQCNEYNNIIATGRKLSAANKVVASKVTYLLGDLTDEKFVASLFENEINVVINCASLSSPWGTYKAFYLANCITQQYLIEESKKSNVDRFIYISSPSIYFDFKDRLNIDEKSRLPKTLVNYYAITKLKAESMLAASGLNYITLRPRALIGKGDTVIMPRLIRSYQEGKLKIMGNGKNIVDLTSISNMVQAVRLATTTDLENCNEAYNISNGAPVNLWQSINQVLEAIGYAPIKRKISYSLLQIIANILELKSKVFNSQQEPVLTKYTVGTLAKSFTFNITKAKNRLNYQPTQTTNDAIIEFANWYKTTSK